MKAGKWETNYKGLVKRWKEEYNLSEEELVKIYEMAPDMRKKTLEEIGRNLNNPYFKNGFVHFAVARGLYLKEIHGDLDD